MFYFHVTDSDSSYVASRQKGILKGATIKTDYYSNGSLTGRSTSTLTCSGGYGKIETTFQNPAGRTLGFAQSTLKYNDIAGTINTTYYDIHQKTLGSSISDFNGNGIKTSYEKDGHSIGSSDSSWYPSIKTTYRFNYSVRQENVEGQEQEREPEVVCPEVAKLSSERVLKEIAYRVKEREQEEQRKQVEERKKLSPHELAAQVLEERKKEVEQQKKQAAIKYQDWHSHASFWQKVDARTFRESLPEAVLNEAKDTLKSKCQIM